MSFFSTLLIFVYIIALYLIVREAYVLFNLYKNYTEGMRVYYVPFIGFQWRNVFWKDKKNEWDWIKSIVADMDKKGQKVFIGNTILGTNPIYILVDSDVINDFFKKEANIAVKNNIIGHPIINMGFFYKNEPQDLKMKGVFSRIFEAENLKKISPEIQAIARENINKLISDHFTTKETVVDIDLNSCIKNIFLNIVDRVLFGECQTKIQGHNFTTAIIDIFKDSFDYEFSAENFVTFGLAKAHNLTPRVRVLKERARVITEAIYEQYKIVEQTGRNDNSFLANMVRYNKEHPKDQISTDNIIGSCALLVFASHDTTRNTTSWALNFLKEDPDTQERIFKVTKDIDLSKDLDIEYKELENCSILNQTVKEVLRIGNPILFSDFKTIIKPCVIGGFKFKKDDLVVITTTGSSSKEKRFPDATHFRPERFGDDVKPTWQRMDYIPFLGGIRGCIGQYLAMLKLKIMIKEFVRAFRLKTDSSFCKEIGVFPFHVMKQTKVRLNVR